jgi:hypothetical protein
MSVSTETLWRQALQLPANDRAALVESLITSLDKPDPPSMLYGLRKLRVGSPPIAQASLARLMPTKSLVG